MTEEDFKRIWDRIPPKCPIILMSDRGMGKTNLLSSVLKEDDKLLDVRLSQAVEGDLIGLPLRDENDQDIMRVPDYWFKNTVIFFDEFCRAHSTIQQLLLKIIFDRKSFGVPDSCRIVIGVDNSSWNDFDPGLINEFFTIRL